MNCSTPGLPVHHQLPEFTQTQRPSSQWCHPAISSSVIPFSSCPQVLPASESFPMSQLFAWGSQSTGVSALASFLPKKFFRMHWLDLLAVQGALKSLLQHHSSKASLLRRSAFFTVQLSPPYMTTGKTIALTRQTFVGKVTSLLLNILSRLVITFLPRSKRLLISWLQSPSAVILEPQKIKSDTVSTVSPSICHEMMGPDAMIFVFWMLSFKPTFSLCSFTFIKRLFSSSSLSAIDSTVAKVRKGNLWNEKCLGRNDVPSLKYKSPACGKWGWNTAVFSSRAAFCSYFNLWRRVPVLGPCSWVVQIWSLLKFLRNSQFLEDLANSFEVPGTQWK